VPKRKSTGGGGSSSAPKAKRKKPTVELEPTADKNAARKFCQGKLEELFVPIFLRYPHLPMTAAPTSNEDNEEEEEPKPCEVEALTDDDKIKIEQVAKAFSSELESAMFQTFAELDKTGKPVVAGKYKYGYHIHSELYALTILSENVSE
jgi:hypothetical protein